MPRGEKLGDRLSRAGLEVLHAHRTSLVVEVMGQYVQKEVLCQEIYVYLKMFFCRPNTKSPSSGERRVACEKRLKSSQSEVAESLLSTKKAQCLLFRQPCSNIYL